MYGDDFYDVIRDGCRDSARAVTGYLAPHITADSIVDVGCGEGWWGCTLADEFGAEVLGVDGPGVPDHAPIRARQFKKVDLRRRLNVGRFDLAVCLEVAEHLPPSRAASFVADLCAAAPVVVFSAAIPGQGGTGHLNEQWPGYWADWFTGLGYHVTGDLRFEMWNDLRVENWYRQNPLICSVEPIDSLTYGPVLPVVHPVLYDARR